VSISIYYSARRSTPLTEPEERAVAAIVARYSVADEVEEYHLTGTGWAMEDFSLYDPPIDTADRVLEGATKLPLNTEDDFWTAIQHWCRALSELRRSIPDCVWHVHVDDLEIEWDEKSQSFGQW
jgi:hypothetical protein